MTEYRKRTNHRGQRKSDVWHFRPDCHQWPNKAGGYYVSWWRKPTSGELCNECRGKARNANG